MYCLVLLRDILSKSGVLEPDELSSMIESNHMGERKSLQTIQEDVNKSTESISTLQSDCTVETSQESVLFDDVRASIQRSAISCDAATPDKSKELGATDASPSPGKLSLYWVEEKGTSFAFFKRIYKCSVHWHLSMIIFLLFWCRKSLNGNVLFVE